MQRRKILRILSGGCVVAAGSGLAAWASLPTAMPMAAIAPWSDPGMGSQAGEDIRLRLLSFALLAPHAHNLQSWAVDLSQPGAITLYCDLQRLLPQTDPYSRQIMLSHGAFLEVLALAAQAHGMRADVALFPQGVFGPQKIDERPVAHIQLSPDAAVRPDPLFAHVLHRHTNRGVYDPTRLPSQQVLSAIKLAAGDGVVVGHSSADTGVPFAELGAIAVEAWRIELLTPRTVMESMRLLRVGTKEVAQHRDGISLLEPLPLALDKLGMLERQHPPTGPGLDAQINGFNGKIASTPCYLWITTLSNDRAAQIAAGRAYVRAQLAATAQGVSFHPLSQALQEYPEQAEQFAKVHAVTGASAQRATVQMWVRLGYAKPVGPSPRRGLKALVRAA